MLGVLGFWGRKVPLPVVENLDDHAKMLMGLIQKKMS